MNMVAMPNNIMFKDIMKLHFHFIQEMCLMFVYNLVKSLINREPSRTTLEIL